jgi:hypothetical protein
VATEGSEPERRFTDGINIRVLTRIFHRDLVDDVLRETRKVEQRSRLLPARVVVYYVLALCLFCEDAYEEVMRKLVNGLQFLGNWGDGWQVPTSSAISQARTRLGEAPPAALFERVATPVAKPGTIGAWYRGWRVMAVDGVVLDVPDTPAAGRPAATWSSRSFGEPTGARSSSAPSISAACSTKCLPQSLSARGGASRIVGHSSVSRSVLLRSVLLRSPPCRGAGSTR